MKRNLKTIFQSLSKVFVRVFQYIAAACILPFYALFHAEGILAVAGVLMGIAGAVALFGFLYIAGWGIFHWLFETDVFQTHPLIAAFALWFVLTGVTGAILIEIKYFDWSQFKKKKNAPIARGSFKAWSQAVEPRKKDS